MKCTPLAWLSGSGAARRSVRTRVTVRKCSAAAKRDIDVADVWVEVDLLDLAEPSKLRTKKMHKLTL